jgi:phosphoglycolate phosphatase
MKFNSMLFDLDGTLVDSAPDLVAALNFVLTQHNKPQVKLAQARNYITHGAKALVQFGFGINDDHPQLEKYRLELIEYYNQNIGVHTTIFNGLESVINSLDSWGIVTNKPEKSTFLLLAELGLRPDVVVCGDSLDENKPSAKPILYAMERLGIDNTLMIGDDKIDIQASKNAGIQSVAVSWGYSKVQPNWDYDFLIHKPQELKQWIS